MTTRSEESKRRVIVRRWLLAGGATLAAGLTAPLVSGTTAAVRSNASARAEVGSRLQLWIDKAEIAELAVKYALATDLLGAGSRDEGLALYMRTFAPDAQIVSGTLVTVGPEAWATVVGNVLAQYSSRQHLMGTILVDIPESPGGAAAQRATMISYYHATFGFTPGGDVLAVLGTYTDEVVRLDEGWRISRREIGTTSRELRRHASE